MCACGLLLLALAAADPQIDHAKQQHILQKALRRMNQGQKAVDENIVKSMSSAQMTAMSAGYAYACFTALFTDQLFSIY
jgi:hypothetical protein